MFVMPTAKVTSKSDCLTLAVAKNKNLACHVLCRRRAFGVTNEVCFSHDKCNEDEISQTNKPAWQRLTVK